MIIRVKPLDAPGASPAPILPTNLERLAADCLNKLLTSARLENNRSAPLAAAADAVQPAVDRLVFLVDGGVAACVGAVPVPFAI
jgi:hypothetical protein